MAQVITDRAEAFGGEAVLGAGQECFMRVRLPLVVPAP